MSLIVFLNSARSKLDFNDTQLINFTYKLIEYTGRKFTQRKLSSFYDHCDKNQDINKFLVQELINSKIIIHKKEYYCEKEDESVLSDLIFQCELCGESVNNNYHEYEDTYLIRKDLTHLIRKVNLNMESEQYIDSPFMYNLKELVKNKDHIIPFFGAGLSIPLGFPSWSNLLLQLIDYIQPEFQPPYRQYIKDGDLLKALNYLKDHSTLSTEDMVKKKIVEVLIEMSSKTPSTKDNNYNDLYSLRSNFYMTTNYDNSFTELATKLNRLAIPLMGNDISDHQKLHRENRQRVIHLHGNIDKPDTMIVTEDDYNNLYNDQKFQINLQSIMSSKSFLFLGFSFSDEFFEKIYIDVISKIKGIHFLIAPNVEYKDARELAKKTFML
ncbi:SIR2 family protein [Geomicrobium sediminis]|uniref:SIR2-like domain-containing protein n=1 Tax=Geomicrobium sediminis TaxID=1347788 RepID=A0ABS2PDR4_9BACL|nr:SIR2 family protein [Geomicrobium sediminis]MBM7632953.1 hypothetical protein [Geomicrobium sediminis]